MLAITNESATSTPKVASLTELQKPGNLKQRTNSSALIQANNTTPRYNHNHSHNHSHSHSVNHNFYDSNNNASKTTLNATSINHNDDDDDDDDDINTKNNTNTNTNNKSNNCNDTEQGSKVYENSYSEIKRPEYYNVVGKSSISVIEDQQYESTVKNTDSEGTVTPSATYHNVNREVHRSRTTVSKRSVSQTPIYGSPNTNRNSTNRSPMQRSNTLVNIASRKRSLQNTSSNYSLKANLETQNSNCSMSQGTKARLRMRTLKGKRKALQSPPPPPTSTSTTSLAEIKSQVTVTNLTKSTKHQTPISNSKNTNSIVNKGASCHSLVKSPGDNPPPTPALKSNIVKTASGTSYIELYHKRLPANHSPYPSDESVCSTTEVRSLANSRAYRMRQSDQKPQPPPKPSKQDIDLKIQSGKNLAGRKVLNSIATPNTIESKAECKENKSNLHFDQLIRERDRFLELCSRNRFYKNPNYAEPWKVFSSISEKLINDVLTTVETDFSIGVSKFVEDFLELETRSNNLFD